MKIQYDLCSFFPRMHVSLRSGDGMALMWRRLWVQVAVGR